MFSIKITNFQRFLNVLLLGILIFFICFFLINNYYDYQIKNNAIDFNNVWIIFSKVNRPSPLSYKFHNLLNNIMNITSIPIKFHIIVDKNSLNIALEKILDVSRKLNRPIHYKFYDMNDCVSLIDDDIVKSMSPYFSSRPGTYYSDALFFISIGLYRIAKDQNRAILLDCDLLFKKDIALLFDQFNYFKKTALFGLAPELTPVYRHVLHLYKNDHNTSFGEYYHNITVKMNDLHPKGFQGYNSGVVLIDFEAIRKSNEFKNIIKNETIYELTQKYNFRGHLGDQDFFTLIGYEYSHLIQTISCKFNRQLCTWWRDHGYNDVFHLYFRCDPPIYVLHGNCNTKMTQN